LLCGSVDRFVRSELPQVEAHRARSFCQCAAIGYITK